MIIVILLGVLTKSSLVLGSLVEKWMLVLPWSEDITFQSMLRLLDSVGALTQGRCEPFLDSAESMESSLYEMNNQRRDASYHVIALV